MLQNFEIRASNTPQCYLCGTKGIKLYTDLADRLFGAPGIWNLKQCPNQNCGLVWLDPMPLPDEIGLAYKNYYTHQEIGQGHSKKLSQLMMDGLRQVLAIVSGLNGMKQDRQYQYLGSQTSGKLLDVGCGAGDYLNLMRTRGWDVEGIDFDVEAAKNASERFGVKVYSGELEDMDYPDRCFDAITMNHLIEHVFQPVKLLQECRRILKPNGCLVIITPNSSSMGHLKFTKDWRGLEPPRHLHIFSSPSLKLLATKAGFKDVDVFTTAANAEGVFRGALSIRKAGHYNTRKNDSSLNVFERLEAIFMQFKEALRIKSFPEIGEEVVMICRAGREQ